MTNATIKLVSKGDKHWESEDGRVVVTYDETFETECDADHSHPMRMRADDFRQFSDSYQRHLLALGARQRGNHMVWQCPGGEVHHYGMWTVSIDGDWTDNVYDTFEQARSVVEEQTGEKVKLVRQRRVAMPLTDGAEMHVTLRDDVSSESLAAIKAVGEAANRLMLTDELQAIEEALVRYDDMMRSEDAPFVDQKLHEHHLKRKAEIEKLLV